MDKLFIACFIEALVNIPVAIVYIFFPDKIWPGMLSKGKANIEIESASNLYWGAMLAMQAVLLGATGFSRNYAALLVTMIGMLAGEIFLAPMLFIKLDMKASSIITIVFLFVFALWHIIVISLLCIKHRKGLLP